MACIEKLLLRGIRSFGPNDEDEARLKFTTPLTIILGQNGCGKTTIIEALKFATCGDTPSNCQKGSAFVHDPKLCNFPEVRGQVKLHVRDVKGKPVHVSRCIQTTQKANNLQFKKLDQTITRKDQTGQDVSISKRCADINADMCIALGVSKPILNFVIFCHQEDSNWPLDEGKKLKERFDEIFDFAKYNKCLHSIKKQIDAMSKVTDSKRKDLNNFKQWMEEAEEKRTKLSKEEGRLVVIRGRMADYENKLGPIKERISVLVAREMDISCLITERAKKTATLEAIKSSIIEYQKGISSEFQGSLEDLKQTIHNFRTQYGEQESKLHKLEAEVASAQGEEQRLVRLASSEQIRLGQLTRDQDQNCERIDQRNRALTGLSQQLNLSSNVMTECDVVRFFGSIERSIKEAESKLEDLREKGDGEEKVLQEKIDVIREEKTKLEQSSSLKNQQIEENKNGIQRINVEIQEVNQSTEKLSKLQKRLENVQNSMDDLTKAVDLLQIDQKIKDSEKHIDKLGDDLNTHDSKVRELQSLTQSLTELNLQIDAKSVKEAEIRKLKNKTEDNLKHLLGVIPELGINHQLQSCIDRLVHDICTKELKLTEKQKKLASLETDSKHLKEKQTEKTRTLSQDQEELFDACENRDYETVLKEVTVELEKAQDEKGTWKTEEAMFKRYVDKLKAKPCCPLCHRGFKETQESQNLIVELEGRIQGLPMIIVDKERQLEQLQERQGRLQQLRPTCERISKLKNEELPVLQSQLTSTESKLEATRQEISTLQTELVPLKADETMAKSIQGDVTLLDQHMNELRKLDREINKLQEKLPKRKSSTSLQDALGEQDKLKKEYNMMKNTLKALQDKRNRHNQELHQLQSEKNSIIEQKLKIQGGVQQKKQLEDKLSQLQIQELVLLQEFDNINEQIQPVTDRLEVAISDKEQTRSSHNRILDQERNRVSGLARQCDEIRKIQEAIAKYERSGVVDKLAAANRTIARLNSEKESVLERKKQLQEQMDAVKAYLTNQQVYERELDDNLKLRMKIEEEKKISGEISELSIKIGGMDLKQVIREKEELKKSEEAIFKDKAHTDGRKQELQNNINTLKAELDKEAYKSAGKKYSDCLVEVQVTEVAHEDLGHYSKALDWAISHFHTQRMKHINDIIGDLWTQIYCGNDIDTIKIVIEEDTSQGNKKRKTYNYRVVQVKNGQELDMRGRCSAGQKMLACLIIRMALAEIFSTKCGILTLDEPTTNLDRENIDRLCSTLANLIQIRTTQRSNFQLIVITHDEEFIDKLTKMHKVDYYFSVSRNPKGKSTVTMMRCH